MEPDLQATFHPLHTTAPRDEHARMEVGELAGVLNL